MELLTSSWLTLMVRDTLILSVTDSSYSISISILLTMPFTGLLKGDLWKDAAIQVFFSLGAAMGSLISLARYNKIKNNCHRQALIVCFANYLFSIMSGMCVYVLLHSEDRGDKKEYGGGRMVAV